MAETIKSGNVPALVTNIEVLHMLQEKITQRNADLDDHDDRKRVKHTSPSNKQLLHRDWIEEKVYEYLKSSASGNVNMKQMPELVSILKRKKKKKLLLNSEMEMQSGAEQNGNSIDGFELTDGEALQILNLMPKEPVELNLVIEDMDSRLNEEEQTRLLELIGTYSTNSSTTEPNAAVQEENDNFMDYSDVDV